MLFNNSVSRILNVLVPISRFNKGEASKIFDEVNENGYKIVVKNNKPACVLITPEKYEIIMGIVNDYYLFVEAEKRIEFADSTDFISNKQMMKELNIKEVELKDVEVEIE